MNALQKNRKTFVATSDKDSDNESNIAGKDALENLVAHVLYITVPSFNEKCDNPPDSVFHPDEPSIFYHPLLHCALMHSFTHTKFHITLRLTVIQSTSHHFVEFLSVLALLVGTKAAWTSTLRTFITSGPVLALEKAKRLLTTLVTDPKILRA